MARPPQGHASPRRSHVEPPRRPTSAVDPLIVAVSRYSDPENPSGSVSFRPSLRPPMHDGGGSEEAAGSARAPAPPDSPRRPTSARAPKRATHDMTHATLSRARPASAREIDAANKRARPTSPQLRAAEPAPAIDKPNAAVKLVGGHSQRGAAGGLRSGAFADRAGTPEEPLGVPELSLAITPRQLRPRPQSAAAQMLRPPGRQQHDWLGKMSTLRRLHASGTPRNSVDEENSKWGERPRTAQTRLANTGAADGGDGSQSPRQAARSKTPPSFSVHIVGDSATANGEDAANRLARPRSSSRRGGREVNAPGEAPPRAKWRPSQIEYRHVARMSAARGERPPAELARPEVALTPGRGQDLWDTFSPQRQQSLMAERTPLTISTLDPAILHENGLMEAAPAMPLFAKAKRPPKASAAVRKSFDDEEAAVATMLEQRALMLAQAFGGGEAYTKAGKHAAAGRPASARLPRGASARPQLDREGLPGALTGQAMEPAAAPGSARGRSAVRPSSSPRVRPVRWTRPRPNQIFTRPVDVQAPELAQALASLALQQAAQA